MAVTIVTVKYNKYSTNSDIPAKVFHAVEFQQKHSKLWNTRTVALHYNNGSPNNVLQYTKSAQTVGLVVVFCVLKMAENDR